MALKKEEKVKMIAELEKTIKGSDSVVFVNFHKLTVHDSTDLRKKLRENGVGYKVAKKTLLKRALESEKIEGDMPSLDGEVAIAFAKDLIAPAREVYSFQKEHKENISILGGVFEGKFMNKEAMMSIATIPPIKVLYGQFVNLINSPIQRFAVVLNQIAEKKA